ncbi:hypothetical protein CR513_57589, partial [Mucuna pruriens]
MIIDISLGFIFCSQKMKCFPLSNSFMPMFKLYSLPKSKFFALIMEGNTHHTHFRNSCNPMTLYLKGNESPFTRLFGQPPDYSTLYMFDFVYYVHLPPQERTKLNAQYVKFVFLGYSPHQKGFLCYDPNLRWIRYKNLNKLLYITVHAFVSPQEVVEIELLTLDENQTWDIVSCPPFVKPLGNKFVLSIKLCLDGFIDRYKARLVVLGNKKECGLDYDETFALVAKMTTVHTILALAASQS